MSLYPLTFRPRLVEKIWGGRRLQSVLGKALPPQVPVGESWELYDFPPGVVEASAGWLSSVVAAGPLAGRTLHDLVVQYGPELVGDVPLVGESKQFPLLVKFLDAREDLSVQIHPSERYAAAHPEAHLKSEAWYILDAEPGSRLYLGLRGSPTAAELREAVAAGQIERHLVSVPARPGDCHYLPSGTVHALGAGILVAEVQTPSDTTFRLYDFGRVDPATVRPRTLHVEQALQCIESAAPAPVPQRRSHVAGLFTTVTRLATSPFFTIEKVRMTEGVQESVPYDQPVVWMMLQGQAEVRVADVPEPTRLSRGDTVLLPARMKSPTIKTLSDCVWLEVTMPQRAGTS